MLVANPAAKKKSFRKFARICDGNIRTDFKEREWCDKIQ
jgi:hypothetical protein